MEIYLYFAYGNKTETNLKDIFEKYLSGEMVSPNEPGYDTLIADIFDTMRTATELNMGYKSPEEVHEYMGKILGVSVV